MVLLSVFTQYKREILTNTNVDAILILCFLALLSLVSLLIAMLYYRYTVYIDIRAV